MSDNSVYRKNSFTRKMRNPEVWVGKVLPSSLDWTVFHWDYGFCDNCHKFHKYSDLHNPVYPTNDYGWWLLSELHIDEAEGFCPDCYQWLEGKAEKIDSDWYRKSVNGGNIPSANFSDAFNIPSIVIGLPNGSTLEVSWITFKCISVFEHSAGEITQVRGDLSLIAFIRQLLAQPVDLPMLLADTRVAACADGRKQVKLSKTQREVIERMIKSDSKIELVHFSSWNEAWYTNTSGRISVATLKSMWSKGLLKHEGYPRGGVELYGLSDAGRAALAAATAPKTEKDSTPSSKPKTVAALRPSEREHKIAIKQGELSFELTISAAISAYTRKYHHAPTLIVLHPNQFTAIDEYAGIEVRYSEATPKGRIFVGVK